MKLILKKLIQRASIALAAIPLMMQIGKAGVIEYNDDAFLVNIDGSNDPDSITLTSDLFGIIDVSGYVAGGDDRDAIILLAENGGEINVDDIYGDETDLFSSDPGDDLISLTASGSEYDGEDYIDSTITVYGDIYGDEGDDEISLVAEYDGVIRMGMFGEDGIIYGNDGLDDISVLAQSYGYIQLNGISAGDDNDEISLTSDDSSAIFVTDDIDGDDGNDAITLLAEDGGYIYISDEIQGDDGDDTILVTARGFGEDSSQVYLEYVYGGADNDEITLLAEDGGHVNIGSDINGDIVFANDDDGNDNISLTATGEDSYINVGGYIIGGNGDDIITVEAQDDAYIQVSAGIQGNAGDDDISLTATGTYGDDTYIYVSGDIQGDDGDDTIDLLAEGGGEIEVRGDILGGAGEDQILLTARGTSGDDYSYIYVEDVIGGDGADIITLLAEDGGSIDIFDDIQGGAGIDTISLTAKVTSDGEDSSDISFIYVNSSISGDDGNDAITLRAEGGGYIDINYAIFGNAGDDVIKLTATNEGVDEYDSYIEVDSIYGDAGADTIELTSTGLTADGDDSSIDVGSIYGGEDIDTITLLTEDGGEIEVYAIHGENGNDVILLTAKGEGSYEYTWGEDTFTGYESSEINVDYIYGGSNDDQITLRAEGGGEIDLYGIYGDDGEDTILLTATGVGLDDDSEIDLEGVISGGSGDDQITLLAEAGGYIDIDQGEDGVGIFGNDGEDIISLTATGEDSVIDLQGGIDSANIDGGSGDDEITLSAAAGGYIEMGDGEDSVGIYGQDGEDTILLTATGEDSVIDIAGDIDGGSYDDEINLLAQDGGSIYVESVYGVDGEDTISITASGENSIVEVDYVSGGSDNDAITLAADDSGTVIVGDSDGDFFSYVTAIDIDDGSDSLTIRAEDNGVVVVGGLISANGGEDVITLDTTDASTSKGAILMFGGINGNNDTDLNLIGGLTSRLDADILAGEDFDGLEGFVEATRGTGLIMIVGEMDNIDTLTKQEDGLALIINSFGGEDGMLIENINVDGGSLYITGELYGQGEDLTQIVVDGGAEIGGIGIWNADVNMETGALSAGLTPLNLDVQLRMGGPPELSINQLHINGSLDLAANTSIRYDLVPQLDTEFPISGNGADLITHTSEYGGQVTFDEGSFIRLSPSDINQVVSDGRYVIVSSDSEIIGRPGDGTTGSGVSVQFNELVKEAGDYTGSLVPVLTGIQTANVFGTNLASFTTLRVVANDGDGEDLVADIVHNYEGLGGSNATLSSFGAAIDSLIYSDDPAVQDFIASLDYSDAASALAVASALSSENEVNKSVAMLNSNYAIHRRLENHLSSARRTGAKGGNIVRQQVSTRGKEVSSPVLMSSNCNVWGLISHDVQDYEASATTSNTDYDGNATAFTAGMDWRVSPTLVAGIMLDGSVGDYDYDGGTSESDSMRIAAYGTWGQATGLYSDFAVAFGDHSMEDSRNFGGLLGGGTNSATDATSIQALATIGYAIQAGGIKHGPFAGLEYQSMDVDGFDVNNAFVPTTVSDYTMESIRALIGYRAETTYGKFSPYASIAYAHEFEDDDVIVNATLAGSPFAVTTDGPGSAIVIGLGTGYMINESLSANVGYRGEITVDSQGMDSHGINMGLDWSF